MPGQQLLDFFQGLRTWQLFKDMTQVAVRLKAMGLGGLDQAVQVSTGLGGIDGIGKQILSIRRQLP